MNVHNCMSDYHHCSTGDYRVIFDIRDTRVAIHVLFSHKFYTFVCSTKINK